MIEAQVARGMPASAASAVRVIGVPDSTSFSRIVRARSTAGEGALSIAWLVIAHPRLLRWVVGRDETYYLAPAWFPSPRHGEPGRRRRCLGRGRGVRIAP